MVSCEDDMLGWVESRALEMPYPKDWDRTTVSSEIRHPIYHPDPAGMECRSG